MLLSESRLLTRFPSPSLATNRVAGHQSSSLVFVLSSPTMLIKCLKAGIVAMVRAVQTNTAGVLGTGGVDLSAEAKKVTDMLDTVTSFFATMVDVMAASIFGEPIGLSGSKYQDDGNGGNNSSHRSSGSSSGSGSTDQHRFASASTSSASGDSGSGSGSGNSTKGGIKAEGLRLLDTVSAAIPWDQLGTALRDFVAKASQEVSQLADKEVPKQLHENPILKLIFIVGPSSVDLFGALQGLVQSGKGVAVEAAKFVLAVLTKPAPEVKQQGSVFTDSFKQLGTAIANVSAVMQPFAALGSPETPKLPVPVSGSSGSAASSSSSSSPSSKSSSTSSGSGSGSHAQDLKDPKVIAQLSSFVVNLLPVMEKAAEYVEEGSERWSARDEARGERREWIR